MMSEFITHPLSIFNSTVEPAQLTILIAVPLSLIRLELLVRFIVIFPLKFSI